MSRVDAISFEFVDLLPPELADGVLYISLEHRTIVHNCCSGCGKRVVTGLDPSQWTLTFDGETVSLSPSIGNGALACNSHYFIRKNKIVWAKPLSTAETRRSQLSDRDDVVEHYTKAEPENALHFWQFIKRWKARR